MIIDFFNPPIDAKGWEGLIDKCYRYRYQNDNYQKVPDNYLGNSGIEGYTKSGIVYQCYFPEKNYDDENLYNHLRDKATKDLKKLERNIEKLKKLGISKIREWHFVIPEYRDTRILTHLTSKRNDLRDIVKSDPEKYEIIDVDFEIVVKVANDFSDEIVRYIRNDLYSKNLKFDVIKSGNIDVSNCESEKVLHIKRKIRAIVGENHDFFDDMVNHYITSYMSGLEILNKINNNAPALFQELFELIEVNKKEVYRKTRMQKDSTLNKDLFDNIMNDFENKIKTIPYLSSSAVSELKEDIIAGWLADCNMEFFAMIDDFYNNITFKNRSMPIPLGYRISYKVSLIVLTLLLNSTRKISTSVVKIQLILNTITLKNNVDDLIDYCENKSIILPQIRFDPSINKALAFGVQDGIFQKLKKGSYKLTSKGIFLAENILEQELLNKEVNLLKTIGLKLNEELVDNIIVNWG